MPPHEVRTLAHERRAARMARDWAAADRLKAEIENAGWRVVDRGVDFALEPSVPLDVAEEGMVLHGAPERVPSLLDTPAEPGITLVSLGLGLGVETGVREGKPGGAGPGAPAHVIVAFAGTQALDDDVAVEAVRLAGSPLVGELADAGVRRVATEWVVLLPTGVECPPWVPLATAIAAGIAPDVAAIGLVGARTSDLHRFDPVAAGDADVLLAGPIAARREDLAGLLPFERRIVSVDRFAQWLSLALRRDAGRDVPGGDGSGGSDRDEDAPAPRRAIVIPGADAGLQERRAREASDDHLAKRDFYRVIDRFGLDPRLLTTDR